MNQTNAATTVKEVPPRQLGANGCAVDRPKGAATIRENGGEGGIRTLDGLPHTAFPVRRPRPLGDLSNYPIWNAELGIHVEG